MDELEKAKFELKKEYKNVFHVCIKGEDFIFRPLSKYEYDNLILGNSENIEKCSEFLCDLCVLYPKKFNFNNNDYGYGGIISALAKNIITYSGFSNEDFIKGLIQKENHKNGNDLSRTMENIILFAFDNISIEEIQNWDIYKLVEMYSRALWLIINLMPGVDLPNTIKLRPPMQINKQQKQPQIDHQALKQKQMQSMGSSFRG